MKVLLTPTLIRFLTNKGFRHCLVKNVVSDESFTTLTPVKVRPSFFQFRNDFDALLSIADVEYMAECMTDRFILVTLDAASLLAYAGSRMKMLVAPHKLHT